VSINQGKPELLILRDISAQFDTVDHNVLFSSLKDRFDLSNKVMEWLRSYLEQLSQTVPVHGIIFDVQLLLSGLPKDSVLGFLVFTIYTRPLGITAQ